MMSNKKQAMKKPTGPKNPASPNEKQTANTANNKVQATAKSNAQESRFYDGALRNFSDPTLSASARASLARSSAVDTMCRVIERDQNMTTDEKLQRLQSVNDTEKGNKEQAHRIATEFTWQDGLIALLFGGALFGLGWLGGSTHPRLPKSAA